MKPIHPISVFKHHTLITRFFSVFPVLLVCLILNAFGQPSHVQAAELRITLVNGVTGRPVPDAKIVAREFLGQDNLKWAAAGKTDSQGKITFELKGLGKGRVYILETRPCYGSTFRSNKITRPGAVTLRAGNLLARVLSGADGKPLKGVKVAARERQGDGKYKWAASGVTDQQGVICFNLSGLGKGKKFALFASSPSDGSTKRSQDINSTGRFTFVVGNKPLQVRLVNGLTGKPIPGQKVSAYQVLDNGKRQWRAERTTDSDGKAVFDLDGLGKGRRFVLVSKPYNDVAVFSEVVTRPGGFTFRAGSIEAKVVSGRDGSLLSGFLVTAAERLSNGKLKWRASGKTDSMGVIRFDFPDLRKGKVFVLYAKSLSDGSTKFSRSIKGPGRFTFVVGNKPLQVRLVNGLTGRPIPGQKVSAYEVLGDGKRAWRRERSTDSEGRAVFDLDGLGSGRKYVLIAKPYNGGVVFSEEIARPGQFVFKVGLLPVKLVDSAKNTPVPGKKLVIYEKDPDGKLHWLKSGVTDEKGIVVFDVPGLGKGTVYVILAKNVFGQGKRYFSHWIKQAGEVLFKVERGETHRIDLKPPSITIKVPDNGALVSHAGFVLRGQAVDDNSIDHVAVTIRQQGEDPVTHNAQYDPLTHYWRMPVTPQMIRPNSSLFISAAAVDTSYNISTATLQLSVILDTQAPRITILSHKGGDKVSSFGFLISGSITDDTGDALLKATLVDPVMGKTIAGKRLEISQSRNRWTLVVPEGKVTPGKTVKIIFEARDAAGNRSQKDINLLVFNSRINPLHLLQRITFGITPTLLYEIDSIGPESFLDRQLHPFTIPDPIIDYILRIWQPTKHWELTAYQLLFSGYSNRQLLEMMTWFWENHFNTDISTHGHIEYELKENQLFREHALGKFKDLLTISARSPAMLRYLDNVSNRKQDPNENYAREIMELHTLGVDGGYTQQDIVEVARAFTGWRIKDGEFFFDARRHDYGEKVVLGHKLPGGRGVEDGYEVIDILSSHPSTSRFICKKLIRFFVTDQPSSASIDQCSEVFRSSSGDIGKVVSAILHSRQFHSRKVYHAKVKTPLEFTAGILRNLPVYPTEWHLRKSMDAMDMRPFHFPLPTGWPETGEKWVSSNQLMQRILFVNSAVMNSRNKKYCRIDIKRFLTVMGYETSEGIVGYLFRLLLANDYTQLEWDIATGILTHGHKVPFDIANEEADLQLKELLGFILSLPSYQLQ